MNRSSRRRECEIVIGVAALLWKPPASAYDVASHAAMSARAFELSKMGDLAGSVPAAWRTTVSLYRDDDGIWRFEGL